MKKLSFRDLLNQDCFSTLAATFSKSYTDSDEELIFLSYIYDRTIDGHIAVSISNEEVAKFFFDKEKEVVDYLKEALLAKASLVDVSKFPLIKKENLFYLKKQYELESEFLDGLRRHLSNKEKKTISVDPSIQLTRTQKEALQKALVNNFFLLSGGPGTGKSYTASFIIHEFCKESKKKVVIAAPTGKAAFHLKETVEKRFTLPNESKIEAMTLHALLGKRKESASFSFLRPISADLLVIDESSMMDLNLFADLFKALSQKTKLLLLGDPCQLPPVGSGTLFSDLASIGKNTFAFSLEQPHRFEKEGLFSLAEYVKRGDADGFFSNISSLDGVFYEEILPNNEYLYKQRAIEFFQKEDSVDRHKILSCMREGPFGVSRIQEEIVNYYPSREKLPLVIRENNYEMALFNGMGGILDRKTLLVSFGKDKTYPLYVLPRYEIGYALSVHTSQGSEFKEVLLIIPPGSEKFGKEILYTAITRAKEKISILGNENTIRRMIQNTSQKQSGLGCRFFETRVEL